MECPLCFHESTLFEANVFLCSHCSLVFKDSNEHLTDREDFDRYRSHQNNSSDQGYRDFLNRVVLPLKEFLPPNFKGLDFGCGPGPTMSMLLEECGGEISNYDPHFFPDAPLLIPEAYEVVTCTEVVEHFKKPHNDWKLLVDLVSDGGVLAVMTQIFNPELVSYQKWWYKNDPTHVVFYQKETIVYLENHFELKLLYTDNQSVLIFKKGII